MMLPSDVFVIVMPEYNQYLSVWFCLFLRDSEFLQVNIDARAAFRRRVSRNSSKGLEKMFMTAVVIVR